MAIYNILGSKFGTHIGVLKANISIKFGVSLINNEGVIGNFTGELMLRLQSKLFRGKN